MIAAQYSSVTYSVVGRPGSIYAGDGCGHLLVLFRKVNFVLIS